MIINILIVIFIFVSLIYWWINKKFSYWSDRNVVNEKPAIPLGNLNGVGDKVHINDRLNDIYNKFKNRDIMCGMYFMTSPVILLTDLDLIKTVLIKNFNSFRDRGLYVNEKDDPLSAHLFSLSGEKWKNMRNKLSPTFTSGKMKIMFNTIMEMADEFNQILKSYANDTGIIDAKNICARYSADVIGSCAFGLNCYALKDEKAKIIDIGKKLFDVGGTRAFYMFFVNAFQNFSKLLGLKAIQTDLSIFFFEIIEKTVTHREQSNIRRNDFMDSLLQLKNEGWITNDKATKENVGKITYNELAAQAFVFFFAGYEPASSTMSFALYELARKQHIQEKLRDEIKIVISSHGGKLNYEAVMEMIYLEQIINETMRLYPANGFLIRIANEDFKVPNSKHVIEKGTQLLIPIASIHTDSDYYPEPTKFDPERFTPEVIKERPTTTFIPFGEGPRNCIGMRFALLETKIAIITLVQNFKLTINSKTANPIEIDPKASNITAAGGIWLNIEKIS